MIRWLWSELVWLIESAGYWLRPYDMLADQRRWRWQRRAPCGREVWASLPAEVQHELERLGETLPPAPSPPSRP